MAEIFADIHKEIIELSKTGNSKAQFQLYQLYAKAMFNICMRMMKNAGEAEDLLQESFIEAFSKLQTFRYESSFGAWLKKIVINKCINSLKKKKADIVLTENIQDLDLEDINEEETDLKLEVNKVREAIEKLPDGYRIIISLYLFEGYDHSEISEILGITESTSKSQYLRAKNKLKEILAANK
ncbi:MAG: sigma-70 family RNA polymerase sigma factor [Bacteroidia bacterium]|nr:sigma-70 family RNA polymerase sigma factor [Bacteroidia bacterium]